MGKLHDDLMESLGEMEGYLKGDHKGHITHQVQVPDSVDVKAMRKRLQMTQRDFASTFGFSVDAVRHWESGRRTPERPIRVLLRVIERNPQAVLDAASIQ